MKKLMIALAAAATTMLSFGAGPSFEVSGTSFEGYPTNILQTAKDDVAGNSGDNYWYTAEQDAENIISNYFGFGETDPKEIPIASRPDYFAPSNNEKFLQLETTSKLFRSALPNGQTTEFTPVEIPDQGIYLDTLVKFTAADDVFGADALEAGIDKIAIEYVEREDDDTTPEINEALTNFVVRAGYVTDSSTVVATNYFASVPAGFDKDAWHRLTVRAISNVGDGTVGFIVYLDGDINKMLTYSAEVSAGYDAYIGALDTVVKDNFYNATVHALFPSAVRTGDDKLNVSAVAFSGNGSIDDVVFTTTMPNFIKLGEEVVATFTADSGVAGISVQVGAADPIAVDMTAETLTATLPAGTTAFTVTVTLDPNGYGFGDMVYGEASYDNGDEITYNGGVIAITTTRNNFNLFDVNGNAIEGTFQTLSEAFAAIDVATIKLAYDYNVSDWGETLSDSSPVYNLTKNVVLDLNGKTLNGGGSNTRFLFSTATDKVLTVIDSVSGDTGKIIYSGVYGIFGGEGDTYLGSNVMTDYGPVIDGAICGEQGWVTEVVRGKFSAADNTGTWDPDIGEGGGISDPNGFVSQLFLAEGSSSELVSGYWVVTSQGGSEPTQIAVPTAESNLVYNGTEQTGVAAGTGYTLTGVTAATDAGEYTATATPVSGYAWVGGSTDATNIIWSIAKVELNAVTVTLDPASATYDSEKDEVTDYTTPSVNFGLGAPELVENTDYTVAWSSTEVSGAGTFTYTVSPVADSNYTFTETSATLTITAGGEYPTYIEDLVDGEAKTAYEKKYDDWKATYGADTESAFGAAFLLNIAPAAADQTLEPVSITMEGGKVVISANQTLTAVNGKVYVKAATTLAGLATAEWTEATLDEGKVQVTPGSSDTAGFYKIKVDF